MIVYYHKKTGKILGTQDMKFIDNGIRMKWDDIPDDDIGVKVVGGKGKIGLNEDGTHTLYVKKDKNYKKVREFEDTDGREDPLKYKIKGNDIILD